MFANKGRNRNNTLHKVDSSAPAQGILLAYSQYICLRLPVELVVPPTMVQHTVCNNYHKYTPPPKEVFVKIIYKINNLSSSLLKSTYGLRKGDPNKEVTPQTRLISYS